MLYKATVSYYLIGFQEFLFKIQSRWSEKIKPLNIIQSYILLYLYAYYINVVIIKPVISPEFIQDHIGNITNLWMEIIHSLQGKCRINRKWKWRW